MLASIIISTFNRASALPPTLQALAEQDIGCAQYEVLVIDDGSTDETQEVLASVAVPYPLRTFRLPTNRGVSAGRNLGMRNAVGRLVVLLSDDLLVPERFLSVHLATHERYKNSWVIGGYKQLDSLTQDPFGAYLDSLEEDFNRAKRQRELEPGIWELSWPTARNLSLPLSDLSRVGFFDEALRVTCEDQDLAMRAKPYGIRYIYSADLECLHNDQAATLDRYCSFQRRGARDTVRLCAKYPAEHGQALVARANAPVSRFDSPATVARKALKVLLSTAPAMAGIRLLVYVAERCRAPRWFLDRGYRTLIGLNMFRGWREGLRELEDGRTHGAARPV